MIYYKLFSILLLYYTINLAYQINTDPDSISYNQNKMRIQVKKKIIRELYRQKKISLDSVGNFFEQTLLNELIPYWYGVGWTFEGHTNSPDSGTIACGYFVSTTLKHFGMNLNRYRLAQQSASQYQIHYGDRRKRSSFSRHLYQN